MSATPSQAVFRIRGLDLTHANERELTRFRRKHVGLVFQFRNLTPSLTALENVSVVTEEFKQLNHMGEWRGSP